MKRYIFLTIPILFFVSALVFPAVWIHFQHWLGIRLDLTPSQVRIISPAMSLLAASFGIPSLKLLFGKNRSVLSGRKAYRAVTILSAVSCVLLALSAVSWLILEPRTVSTGIAESITGGNADGGNQPDIRDGLFNDTRLGISVRLPQDWHVLSTNAIRRAHEAGSQQIFGKDPSSPEPPATPAVDQFLAIQKYPAPHDGYNPSLAFVSYEKTAMKKEGKDSLAGLVRPWTVIGPPYTSASGPANEKVGTFDGCRVRLKADFSGTLVQQHILAFETKDHYVSVTISISDLKDRDFLESVVRTITESK